jgi:Zn-dependent M28 family amino/carboxypeptidase
MRNVYRPFSADSWFDDCHPRPSTGDDRNRSVHGGHRGGMTRWIGETFTSDAGWDHLERLVDVGNRMAGSRGEREALEATRDALDDAGARNARIETFEIRGWERGSCEIRTPSGPAEAIALPRSPAGDASGRLVDCGHGLPADFEADLEGAIVIVSADVPDHHDRFIHRREKYCRAAEAGAAAFVFRNHVPGCLAPTGSVGVGDGLGPIPAVGVSREVGERLVRRHEGDRVTVGVDCETPRAESGTVAADVGPDTEEVVYLTSHVDAHDIAEGAVDNGAGTATVLEVVHALLAREADLDCRVSVRCFGAEEVGLRGSRRTADIENLDAIRALVNCDGVCRARTLKGYTHGFEGLDDALAAVGRRFDHPVSVVPTQHPHSDHWPFVARGVPAVLAQSETGERGRGWGHTAADTLDKLEVRTLRETAILLTELVVDLTGRELAHRDPAAVAADIEAEGLARGMKVTGDWPF